MERAIRDGRFSLISTAATCGAVSCFQRFLCFLLAEERGVSVDTPDEDGSSPLIAAAWTNQLPIVRYLLSQGANINHANYTHAWTALHAAAAKGHADVVAFLLSKGADPTLKDAHNQRPSMYAVFHGYDSIRDLLVQREGELTAQREEEETTRAAGKLAEDAGNESAERSAGGAGSDDTKGSSERIPKPSDGRSCAECIIM